MYLGTRGSMLAIAQAQEMKDTLIRAGVGEGIMLRRVKAEGDGNRAPIAGAGSFTGVLNRMVLDGDLDAAVHSMKDLPLKLPDDLEIAVVPARKGRRDCIVGPSIFSRLPSGSRVGTSSMRRRLQILSTRKDLIAAELRGNVTTRISSIGRGVDAIVVAEAGLERLDYKGVEGRRIYPLPLEHFVPAAGQGALALVSRPGRFSREIIARAESRQARMETEMERHFLASFGAGCSDPLGVTVSAFGNSYLIRAQYISADLRKRTIVKNISSAGEADELAADFVHGLREEGLL